MSYHVIAHTLIHPHPALRLPRVCSFGDVCRQHFHIKLPRSAPHRSSPARKVLSRQLFGATMFTTASSDTPWVLRRLLQPPHAPPHADAANKVPNWATPSKCSPPCFALSNSDGRKVRGGEGIWFPRTVLPSTSSVIKDPDSLGSLGHTRAPFQVFLLSRSRVVIHFCLVREACCTIHFRARERGPGKTTDRESSLDGDSSLD